MGRSSRSARTLPLLSVSVYQIQPPGETATSPEKTFLQDFSNEQILFAGNAAEAAAVIKKLGGG
jgi:hypothetical protein